MNNRTTEFPEQAPDSGQPPAPSNNLSASNRPVPPNEKQSSCPVVALAGNPNCGKTTLFNALTGLRYKVANYPGVTVEKKQGSVDLDATNCGMNSRVILFDLPGIYSLAGTSIDEKIATAALLGEIAEESVPDAIVVVADSSNLERNLYLVTQLIDFGIPLLVALNMGDLAEKNGISIQNELLAKELDLPVVSIQANTGRGLPQLRMELQKLLSTPRISTRRFAWLNSAQSYHDYAQHLGEKHQKETGDLNPRVSTLLGVALLSEAISPSPRIAPALNSIRADLTSQGIDSYSFEATSRYQWINAVVKKVTSRTEVSRNSIGEKLDRLITHKLWGTAIFVGVMTFIFQSIFLWAQLPMEFIDNAMGLLSAEIGSRLPEGQLRSLVTEGIIAGVGNVLIFVPQIAILFFFLGLLEDSGYLSRAAVIMDRVMRPFGLQGRSFIPLLSSFACAIPGILSSRTIPSWADRMATIMVAPLMSCSARLPVYAVLIGAFIPAVSVLGFVSLQGLVLLGMYALGVIGAALVAWLLKKIAFHGTPALFVMELPPMRRPSLRIVLREVFDRVMTFTKSAGTVILACSIVLWFLASYPRPTAEELTQSSADHVRKSYAGQIGHALEPVIRPLGLGWEVGIGILASFAAREVFVSTLATVYNVESEDENTSSLIDILKAKRESGEFSVLSALSLMVFYVFACQCMSTLAVCKRETGSWAWTAFMFVYMTTLAYVASLATYQIGTLFFG